MFLADAPNRFLLQPPSEAWVRAVSAYDPDLRVFCSQVRPVFRVARVRRFSSINHQAYRALPQMHPDTAFALLNNLILVNWSFVANAFQQDVDGKLTVQTLRDRDTHRLSAPGSDSTKAAEALEAREAEEQAAQDTAYRDKTRQIGRAARLAVLYRTGQRVSLSIPLTPAFKSAAPSHSIPLAASV